jgi:hypothetical protein
MADSTVAVAWAKLHEEISQELGLMRDMMDEVIAIKVYCSKAEIVFLTVAHDSKFNLSGNIEEEATCSISRRAVRYHEHSELCKIQRKIKCVSCCSCR